MYQPRRANAPPSARHENNIRLPLELGKRSRNIAVVHAENLPLSQGGDSRILTVMHSLQSLGFNVTFIFTEIGANREFEHVEYLKSIGFMCWGPLPRDPRTVALHLKVAKYSILLAWLWTNEKYLLELQYLVEIIRGFSPSTVFATVSDDLIEERYFVDQGKHWKFSSFEKKLLTSSDVRFAINEHIAASIRRLYKRDVEILPFYLPLSHTELSANPRQLGSGVAYVGFDNAANAKAMRWMCRNIIHVFEKRFISFHVYGTVQVPPKCRTSHTLKYHGPVDDKQLCDGLGRARWFLSPVFSPAGISTKVLHSLRCGTPVLTTLFGASGLPHMHVGVSPVQVRRPSQLLESLIDLYYNEELSRELADESLRYVELHFSFKAYSNNYKL